MGDARLQVSHHKKFGGWMHEESMLDKMSLEFFNWDGLPEDDVQILNEALKNGSGCVELPWQDEEHCLDTDALPSEQPGLPSCADTLEAQPTLVSPMQETLPVQPLYVQPQQVYPPAQYSENHHHLPVVNPEMVCDFNEQLQPQPTLPLEGIGKRPPGRRVHHRNKGMHHNSRAEPAAPPPTAEVMEQMEDPVGHMPLAYAPGQTGYSYSFPQPVYYMCVPTAQPFYSPTQGHHPLSFVTAMVSPQPPPHVAMAAPSTLASEPVTAAHYAEPPDLSLPRPARPGEPSSSHSQRRGFRKSSAGHVTEKRRRSAKRIPSHDGNDCVSAATMAATLCTEKSKEEVASPVTTSTSETLPAVVDNVEPVVGDVEPVVGDVEPAVGDVEPGEFLASSVPSEADEAMHEIAKPASPLATSFPTDVPEVAVPVVEQPPVPVEQARAVTTVEESCAEPPVVNGSGSARRCWADLFKKGSGEVEGASKLLPLVPFGSNCEDEVRPCGSSVPESVDVRLGRALHKFTVDHSPPLIQPRGLENGKNWCYINANLQALLACPAFFNLLNNLPLVPGLPGSNATPFMECLIYFLQTYAVPMVRENGKKGEMVVAKAYDPARFRNLLMKIKPDCKKGKQEDAEEFLSFMLNGLHDEMVLLMRSVSNGLNGQCNGEAQPPVEYVDDDDEGAWKTVIHRNRHQVTRSAEYLPSPLMDIFGGEMRSSVTADGETSASLQPFFTLQLDIQDGFKSVDDALLHLAAEEKVQNYHSSKSNKEVDALRRTTLEKLPLVLILHLKRFVYDKHGGCKKLMNSIHIPHQLQLDRKLVPSSERWSNKQRCYILFAVLSHSGERTDKGHYVTDAFHPAGRRWFRCDDDNVSPIAQGDLLRFENSSLVPYLLFYRRADTEHQAR
ncbi:ubiquitin carboxyl-terminal hydrolase 10-B isoform X3 [Rhipicephalus microplus]|uniref:ubiquitin carboxyl-terminal hydrolase 10-B isoform X3 n=1 Tax=Rhipicephalus microplus TaxID=6941 RepID=UPI003F6B3F81